MNPHASLVDRRVRELVRGALARRYEVREAQTEAQGHGRELAADAVRDGGYEMLVTLGGDGTVNEAVNGLHGGQTPLLALPAGSANVYSKMLGLPGDLVDATARALAVADDFRPRRVDVGRVNERLFAFCAGVGLDASVVERVDARPHLKARFGPWFFSAVAVGTAVRRYVRRGAPRFDVHAGGERVQGITAIIQNGRPYTFFGGRPIDVARQEDLRSGRLSGGVLHSASALTLPSVARRAISSRANVTDHRRVSSIGPTASLTIESVDGRPLPLQADGDYLGAVQRAEFTVLPESLSVIS